MGEEDKGKALFNAGVAKLMRIDNIKKQCHNCRVMDDEPSRRRWLGAYRSEINERLNTDEKDKCKEYEEKIDAILHYGKGAVKFDTNMLDYALNEYELYLCDLEYKYGFSMPDAEDAGAALR